MSRSRGRSTGQTRTGTATEASDGIGQNVAALIENRALEVGIAVYNLRSFDVELRQFGDNNLYTTTLTVLSVYE